MAGYAILSDIHGNLYALEAVIKDMADFDIEGVILLGDLIDYGMQSNEVVQYLHDRFRYKILCNIWGNHERAIMLSDFQRFSSQRGVESAKNTAKSLTEEAKRYLDREMCHEGCCEFLLDGLKCLAVHGSAEDVYWKPVLPDDVHGDYGNYDLVFSGHSHYPHIFTKFYDADDIEMRNKHAVMFINPGSIGQPRNHNPYAQYMIFDTAEKNAFVRCAAYDVEAAMRLFDGASVDLFYRDRLLKGV
jgi:predicted phosphodiesterase